MIYNLKNKHDQQRFKERCNFLYKEAKTVVLKEKRYKRTFKQNRYLHLILSWYGLEIGYTLEEMKQEFKTRTCPELFRYTKKCKTYYRGTSDLDTLEMTIFIDKIRDHASGVNGIYLPAPNETALIASLEEQLQRYGNRQYI